MTNCKVQCKPELITVNKNADSPEERKWSFVLSSTDGKSGGLNTLWLPVCTRQQQHLLHNLFHPLFHLLSGESPTIDAH
jgi:hypothetical protein